MASHARTKLYIEAKKGRIETNVEKSQCHHTQSRIIDFHEKLCRAPLNYLLLATYSEGDAKPK